MNTIVMTGATSFLGRNVLKGLLDKGYIVYALVRKTSPYIQYLPSLPNLKLIYGSLDDLDHICNYAQRAEWFIHFAWDGTGYGGRADKTIQQKNIEYSLRAARIAREIGCEKFVFSGSQAEYGINYDEAYEDMKCSPVSEYGKAKLRFSEMANDFCLQGQMKFIHLRIFSVYGIGDREGTLVDSCIKKFNNGEQMLLGSCMQDWNYLYIKDFVYMILKILESRTANGIYNIASKDTRIMRDFVNEIYALSNKSGTYKFTEAIRNPEGSPSLRPNTDKIMKLIGNYKMTSFSEGIKEIMCVPK